MKSKCVIFASTIPVSNLLLHCESLVPFSDTLQTPNMKNIPDYLQQVVCLGPKVGYSMFFLVGCKCFTENISFYIFHPSKVH